MAISSIITPLQTRGQSRKYKRIRRGNIRPVPFGAGLFYLRDTGGAARVVRSKIYGGEGDDRENLPPQW